MYERAFRNTGFLQPLDKQSSVQKHPLGMVRVEHDGRMFAYAKAGASDLAHAKFTQSPVVNSNAHNEAIAAAADIGATTLSVTFGGAVLANAFADGFLHVNDATGEGYAYRIKQHAAGTTTVAVELHDPIKVALVASTSEITLSANPFNGTLIHPTASTGIPTGVPLIDVTATYYYWSQVKGLAPCLTDGTIEQGEEVCPSNGTAGALELYVAGTTLNINVGVCYQLNATTEYSLIQLNVPGF